ncbi:MAG: AAA family ATPase [Gemmatimonadetes bacterium]|nr:AAA family ATPase [Gemmatimonadota bacterium]
MTEDTVSRETPTAPDGGAVSRETSRRARVLAIANQKGGVGKTTTAVNLAASLAVAEMRTLLVDIDPQGNATSGLGVDKESLRGSIYEVIVGGAALEQVRVGTGLTALDLVPATVDLFGAEIELVGEVAREHRLRQALEPVRDEYDYVLVDCPPSLGLLTVNALAGVDAVLIPIQSEYYALEGLSQLLGTIRIVQKNLNPGLEIEGVLLTMYDSRLNLARQVEEEAVDYFGEKVYATVIPRNVRLSEAPSFGKPALLYDAESIGAVRYLKLAEELIQRCPPGSASEKD